ncbi:porin [Burkholderia ambifaria]|uniref:porin n=1 Tax=Burkholderia ambifaria TaxID=152480 RepID=UPI00158942AB|nr:porin [Burkholderia ambifaria]MBR8346026.1 porin [Burkholderia ambifaria]
MKHKTAMLCTLFCAVTNASAQDSVTLYGLIDQGIGFTNNAAGKQAWQTQSGWTAGDRWGLKGVESLGAGNAAIFTLENGFVLDSGRDLPSGMLFGRQAFVGLQNTQWGSVTFGRQYDSIQDYLAPLTANGRDGGWPFAHPYDNDNAVATFRLSNAVKFSSANYGGLQFGGVYAFGNTASFANNRSFSLGIAYKLSSLSLAAAYLQADSPGATGAGAVSSTDANFVARRQRVWGAGANYDWGPATLGLTYTHTVLNDPVSSTYFGTLPAGATLLRFDNVEANVRYQVTPTVVFAAMYAYTLGRFDGASGDATPRWHQAGLMLDYLLSKRTFLYTQAVYQHVGGDAAGTVFGNAYITGSAGISSTRSQVLGRVGIRTVF